jgi:hypothetical protein
LAWLGSGERIFAQAALTMAIGSRVAGVVAASWNTQAFLAKMPQAAVKRLNKAAWAMLTKSNLRKKPVGLKLDPHASMREHTRADC